MYQLLIELIKYHEQKTKDIIYNCIVIENNIRDNINLEQQEYNESRNYIDHCTSQIKLISSTTASDYDSYLHKIKEKRRFKKERFKVVRNNHNRFKIIGHLSKELSFIRPMKTEYIKDFYRLRDERNHICYRLKEELLNQRSKNI